jgi:hypothetical protein
VTTNPNVEFEANKVLGVVSRALNVFGGDVEPLQPPAFAVDRALEDDLGRGQFGSSAPVSERAPLSTGDPADVDGDGVTGDRSDDDVADRSITSGSRRWPAGGAGKRS